jgi:hypothetical protein
MIQAKTLFRAALLAILVLFGSLAVNVAVPTSATALPLVYGNVVIEGYGSTANLLVVGTGSSTFRGMRPNTSSDSWPAFVRNVRAFYVPPGYTAVSRYGYGYASGWHHFLTSYNTLYLQVESNYCWFLRTQVGTPCKIPLPS